MFNVFKRAPRIVYNAIIAAAPYIVPVLALIAEASGGDFPPVNI